TGHKCEYQDPPLVSKMKSLQDQIKHIEARIAELEKRPEKSSAPSRTSGFSHNEANLEFDTLLPLSTYQASPPTSVPDDPVYEAPDPSSYLTPGTSIGLNMLMPRGPSNLSVPGEASRKLLNMFMQQKVASGFELHTGRVIRSFQPGSSEPLVPALYYAMLLLGCHFISEPSLKFWENTLYERTKLEIEANIAKAYSNDRSTYNSLYHLQAMVLLGQWFYFKCRLLEGYVYMTRAMQIAVALGIHELDSRSYSHYIVTNQKPPRRGIERWSPRNPIELGEAINLWWACLARDFIGTILNGLPPSISLEEIKTVWPVSLSEFENLSGSRLYSDNYSVGSLFDPEYFHVVTNILQDTANSIIAKATILICTAGKLDTERISGLDVTEEWWAQFKECDRAIQSFAQSARKAYAGRGIEDVVNISLCHTAVDCATIQLHGPLADYELDVRAQGGSRGLSDNPLEGYSHTRCIEACRSMALAIAYIEGIDISYMQMFLGILWSSAARVLANQIPRLRQNGYVQQACEMEQYFRTMVKNVEKLVLAYPVLAPQAEHLRTLLP
ncbi:unnamed protein product, partial [Rhizoctonia solani]